MVPFPPTMLLAAGLASASMLFWLAAAAIPVLIHLMTRRRQQTVRWAAMELLSQVMETEARRVRFEQLLLLLIRIAILVLLAFALARPFLNDPQATAAAMRGPQLWLIGIDVSYSMGYRSDKMTRLQEAKDRALELIEASGQGDAYVLIELADPARAQIRRPTFDRESMITAIRNLQLADTASDVASGFELAEEILKESKQSDKLPEEARVVFISDAGRDAWEPVIDEAFRNRLTQLSQMADLEVVSLGEGTPRNIAVMDLRPNAYRVLVGNEVLVTSRIENFSAQSVRQLPVQFSVDGKTTESNFVDLQPNASASVTFAYTPQQLGQHTFSVSIPGDSLVADNDRNGVIDVVEQQRILCVEAREGDTRLLRMSLAPDPKAKRNSTFRTLNRISFLSEPLDAWDAIMISDLATTDQAFVNRLSDYVRQGGRLIVAFGPKTQSTIWSDSEEANPLLGLRLDRPSGEDVWGLDPLEYKSPVVEVFSGFPDAGLLTTPVFRYWKVSELAKSLKVDLAIANGDPLLVRNNLGQGVVASILSAPETAIANLDSELADGESSWNAMATWPSFVPLMQQLLATMLDSDAAGFNLQVSQHISGEEKTAEPTSVDILNPTGLKTRVVAEADPRSSMARWQYSNTRLHGVYSAQVRGGRTIFYAVNLDPVQSGLETVSLEGLPTQAPERASTRTGTAVDPTAGIGIARVLLVAMLILLMVETAFAWYLGRRVG